MLLMYFCASNYQQVSVNKGESLILAWCEYSTVSVGLLKHTFLLKKHNIDSAKI